MAFCPKCSRAMGAMEPSCPSCGYNFLVAGDGASITGQAAADSPTVTAALIARKVGAGLGASWAALKAVASAFQGQVQTAATALLACLLLVGFLGPFLRASRR